MELKGIMLNEINQIQKDKNKNKNKNKFMFCVQAGKSTLGLERWLSQ